MKTLQFVPTPTGTSGGQPFFSSSAEKIQFCGTTSTDLRSDVTTARWNTFGYYTWDDANFLSPYNPLSNVPGFPVVTPSRAQQISVNYTSIINPVTVNEFHVGYTRFAFIKNEPQEGLGKNTDFGFVEGGLGVIPSNPKYDGMASIGLSNTGLQFGLPDGVEPDSTTIRIRLATTSPKVKARHTLKFGGGDVRYIQATNATLILRMAGSRSRVAKRATTLRITC